MKIGPPAVVKPGVGVPSASHQEEGQGGPSRLDYLGALAQLRPALDFLQGLDTLVRCHCSKLKICVSFFPFSGA